MMGWGVTVGGKDYAETLPLEDSLLLWRLNPPALS